MGSVCIDDSVGMSYLRGGQLAVAFRLAMCYEIETAPKDQYKLAACVIYLVTAYGPRSDWARVPRLHFAKSLTALSLKLVVEWYV